MNILKKSWIVIGIVILLSIATNAGVHGASPSIPEGVPDETYYAAFPTAITLDGKADDWATIPRMTVTDGPQPGTDPSKDGALTFAAAADNDNLYFLFQVKAQKIVAGTHDEQYWNEDSVELYLNATQNFALTDFQPGVVQITLPAANIGLPPEQAKYGGINWEATGIRSVTVKTADGYMIEAALPMQSSWWDLKPRQGKALGFQVQLNAATQKDRDIKLSWSKADKTQDQSHLNPSVFGKLIYFQVGSAVAPTQIPTAASSASANFSVRGSKIYDPSGHEFVAKGINVNGFNWVWSRSTVGDVDGITTCWNFNLVRVNSFLFSGQTPYPQYANNNDLDQIVQAFTSRGVVVVFEGHDRIGSYYQGDDLNKLVQWFTGLATQYRDNPYVWFDVMNEPGGRKNLDTQNWLNTHRQVIQGIRDVAKANNVILVEGAYGGQDAGVSGSALVSTADSAILQLAPQILSFNGKTYSNIAFSIHTYDLWNAGDAKMANFFDQVIAKKLAIIVGEYGVDAQGSTQAATQSVFDTAVPRGIGRIVWQWDGSDNNDLTTSTSQGGGWEINSCKNPTNLSWLGQHVWDDNHTHQ